MESLLYDLRMRARPAPATSTQIVLINIDSQSIAELKRIPEVHDHILLLGRLKEAMPRQIVYAYDPGEIVGSYEDLQAFSWLAMELPFVALTEKIIEPGMEEEVKLLPPLETVPVESAPLPIDEAVYGRDSVLRRLVLANNDTALFHLKMASVLNGEMDWNNYRGIFEVKKSVQSYIQFRPAGSYQSFSFTDVLTGKVALSAFENKIVIVGRDTRIVNSDYVMTPYSRDIFAMSKAEAHANILDTIAANNSPVRPADWVNFWSIFAIAFLTVFIVLNMRPTRGLTMIALVMVSFLIFSWILFLAFEIWVDVTHPTLAVFICYYFFIPYRLIVENRRSWEYIQKNTLLTQVEELKTNFLKMMSHDLKTPLARIQGMTEIALGDSTPLSFSQKNALQSIRQSTDELIQFVGSVLSLSRIESKEVKLQLKSKDLNALLTDVIAKVSYLAKQKNIRIVTEFEPLFSVRVDEDLMRQVFTNLVENAIKYSPENTSVLVSTEEIDGRVLVQVADQGFGIKEDEVNHLFSKFYRASTTKDNIRGTGLGLYLSKYFVELHKGKIGVESELQKGSTFYVELPMQDL